MQYSIDMNQVDAGHQCINQHIIKHTHKTHIQKPDALPETLMLTLFPLLPIPCASGPQANFLTGGLPSTWSSLTNLLRLNIGDCDLVPPLPGVDPHKGLGASCMGAGHNGILAMGRSVVAAQSQTSKAFMPGGH